MTSQMPEQRAKRRPANVFATRGVELLTIDAFYNEQTALARTAGFFRQEH
jgi:hypothetical protein